MSELIPPEARQAFEAQDELRALALLKRARNEQPTDSAEWAYLERLVGLLLIRLLREVEGTFALERADARLEALGLSVPGLEALAELEG